jgi:hypothetical protein
MCVLGYDKFLASFQPRWVLNHLSRFPGVLNEDPHPRNVLGLVKNVCTDEEHASVILILPVAWINPSVSSAVPAGFEYAKTDVVLKKVSFHHLEMVVDEADFRIAPGKVKFHNPMLPPPPARPRSSPMRWVYAITKPYIENQQQVAADALAFYIWGDSLSGFPCLEED